MIAKLYDYFGLVGIASIPAWTVAFGLLLGYARRPQRTRCYWIAAGLAVLGLLLARINSHYVSAIEVDRSAELAAGIERQKQLRAQMAAEIGAKAANIRFVEDTPTDHLDLAGQRDASQLDKYEAAAAEPDFAYRRRGKQQRTVSAESATGLPAVAEAPAVEAQMARTMPEADYLNANRLDRFNLFFARLAFWLALALVGYDYLSRFNRTRDHLWPLPLSCQLLDNLWPKPLSTWFRSATPESLRDYLENLVRKNENFILCAPADPWPDAVALPRLGFRQWAWWPRYKLVATLADAQRHDNEFLFESAWFHRYAIVIVDPARAEAALGSFIELLELRRRTAARARQTLHLVWAFPTPPKPDTLQRLLKLCPPANIKPVLATPDPAGAQFAETL